MIKSQIKNSGFTLLLALVVIGIVLVVGLGVFDIILREIALSAEGRESQKAFYAADTGVECALYYDTNHLISTTTPPGPSNIKCANQTINNVGGSPVFTFEFSLSNGACVSVNVDKSSPTPPKTTIKAKGYNVDCSSNTLRKVERALKVTY